MKLLFTVITTLSLTACASHTSFNTKPINVHCMDFAKRQTALSKVQPTTPAEAIALGLAEHKEKKTWYRRCLAGV